MFSTLNFLGLFDTGSARVLDIFAGSGSVGLESISRGAAHATFVDLSQNCIDTARKNAFECGFASKVLPVCASAQDVLLHPTKFGITEPYQFISITPPYQEVIYSELIAAVCKSPCVTEDTIVLIEYPIEMGSLPYILGEEELFGVRNRKYGRTMIALYVYRPTKRLDMRPDEFLIPQ